METITTGTFYPHTFEIVEKIPNGFFIWNIGENMERDDYIPLCEKTRPNDPECYDVNVNTLKAIRLDPSDVQKLRNAAHNSVVDLKTAEGALKSHRRGYWSDCKRKSAAETIEIFKKITA